jgi:5-methylcytosine-specific restriction protein A
MPIFPKPLKNNWQAKQPKFEGYVYTTFYSNAAWRRLRLSFISKNPLCLHCANKGIVTPASDVDHIHPINPHNPYDTKDGKYGRPLDPDNLQALCKQCHNRKSAKQKGIETR